MTLRPLRPATGSAANLLCTCVTCKVKALWNKAAADGWVADLEGPAFHHYYCPECIPRDL